jgi:hypothetical protein
MQCNFYFNESLTKWKVPQIGVEDPVQGWNSANKGDRHKEGYPFGMWLLLAKRKKGEKQVFLSAPFFRCAHNCSNFKMSNFLYLCNLCPICTIFMIYAWPPYRAAFLVINIPLGAYLLRLGAHLTSINTVPKGIIVTIKEQSNWFPTGYIIGPAWQPTTDVRWWAKCLIGHPG